MKIPYTHFRKTCLTLSVSAAIAMSPFAYGQEATEIAVTGSRIRVTDGMAEPTPVTSLTIDDLSRFEPGGTIAEQLDSLPQFFLTGTAQRGGNALFSDGGGSYLDLRGLGRNRTLVLLDGTRVVPADKRGTVNVDTLPNALVRSVDVQTGGASAAYGADALGGVTNFILDRQFEGLKVRTSTGMNEYNKDGKNYNLSVAGGKQFGESLNIIGSLETRHIDEIYRPASELDSDWFQRWGAINNPDPNGPDRITVPNLTPTNMSPSGVISAPGSALNGLQFTEDGSGLRPVSLGNFTSGAWTSGGAEAENYNRSLPGPISGDEVNNHSAFLGARYEFSDSFSVHGQLMWGRAESIGTAEHADFAASFPWSETIYRDNAYLPASVAAIMDAEGRTSFSLNKVGSYDGELEPGSLEISKTVFTTESWSIGFEKVFSNDWVLSGSWQSGESRKRGGEYPSIRVDREALARDAVIDPATGAIVCNVQLYNPTEAQLAASPGVQGRTSSRGGPLMSPIGLDNTIRDCVPYNAMGAGNMTQQAAEYVHTTKIADTWVKQDFAEILLQGTVFDGWGYGPLSFASGFTWREQSFADRGLPVDVDFLGPPINDPALGIRGIAGAYVGGSANLHNFSTVNLISGEYDVWEWFGELQIPIWESSSGAQRLGGNVAYRTSDYSSSGIVESWKAGLDFQLFEDLRLRATTSQDVREASFAERFDSATGGANVNDPFNGNASFNVTVFSGGNPDLRPEFADTNVVGLVYEPGWFEGFSVSADWYEVDITDAVDTISNQEIVDQCFENGVFCDNLSRDQNGVLVAVRAPYLNLAQSRVEGVDLELRYSAEPDFFGSEFETFTMRGIVGKLIERSDTPLGGSAIQLDGSTARPDYTGMLSGTYGVGAFSLTWQQQFVSETLLDTRWVEGVDIDDNTVPFYSWTNLRFAYQAETGFGGQWTVGLAVNNAFNKNPAIIPSTAPAGRLGVQTISNTFDEFGRRYQLTLDLNF